MAIAIGGGQGATEQCHRNAIAASPRGWRHDGSRAPHPATAPVRSRQIGASRACIAFSSELDSVKKTRQESIQSFGSASIRADYALEAPIPSM